MLKNNFAIMMFMMAIVAFACSIFFGLIAEVFNGPDLGGGLFVIAAICGALGVFTFKTK